MIMSKIAKRSKKYKKDSINCLVIGDLIDGPEFLDYFKTVFVLAINERSVKGRNVVYKEKFNDVAIISNIDFVFFDINHFDQFEKISGVLTYFRAPIYVNAGELLPREQSKKFTDLGFEIKELEKKYQIWKSKK